MKQDTISFNMHNASTTALYGISDAKFLVGDGEREETANFVHIIVSNNEVELKLRLEETKYVFNGHIASSVGRPKLKTKVLRVKTQLIADMHKKTITALSVADVIDFFEGVLNGDINLPNATWQDRLTGN